MSLRAQRFHTCEERSDVAISCNCHCEERSDASISSNCHCEEGWDSFALLGTGLAISSLCHCERSAAISFREIIARNEVMRQFHNRERIFLILFTRLPCCARNDNTGSQCFTLMPTISMRLQRSLQSLAMTWYS